MIKSILLLIFDIILAVLLILGLVVLVQKQFFHKTTDEAMQGISNWFEKVYKKLEEIEKSKQPRSIPYWLWYGHDGFAVRDDEVHKSFSALYKIWRIYYFEYAFEYSPDLICYRFRVYEPVNENFDKTRLVGLARVIAEKALVERLHDFGIYQFNIDNYIAVTLRGSVMCVFIAQSDEGIKQILQIRSNSH